MLLPVSVFERLQHEGFDVSRSCTGRLAGVRLVVAAVTGGTAVLLVVAADSVGKGAAAVLAASQLAARVS